MIKANFLSAGWLIILLLLSNYHSTAQQDKSQRPSPPAQTSTQIGDIKIVIDYSQPSLKGRDINQLAPVGEVWRTGANEASWISVSDDVKVNGKPLPKGKYGLFTINSKDRWTIIFNAVWEQWGSYNYDKEQDMLRIEVDAETANAPTEKFTISAKGGNIQLLWGNVVVPFKITPAQ